MTPRPRLRTCVAIAAVGLALGSCGSDQPAQPQADAGTWPRTINHASGKTVLPAQPQRVVSASVGLTGTLLAIHAPVAASPAGDGERGPSGFPEAWASTAKERDVQALPKATSREPVDIAAVAKAKPDLIVVERQDLTEADAYQELTAIAPTVVVGAPGRAWPDLAKELGTATGHEGDARQVVTDFNAYTVAAARKIRPPEGTASIVDYRGKQDSAVGKASGSHAALLRSLGFRVAPSPAGLDSSLQRSDDFAWVSRQNLPKAITGRAVFLLTSEQSDVARFRKDPQLGTIPAVQASAVYALGSSASRLDYYSATHLVDRLVEQFG